MNDNQRKAMFAKYYQYGVLKSTDDPRIVSKLKENDKTSQSYYEHNLTPFENYMIAKGSSAGEVYTHVFGNYYVTPHQKHLAKSALESQSKTGGYSTYANATRYLKMLKHE